MISLQKKYLPIILKALWQYGDVTENSANGKIYSHQRNVEIEKSYLTENANVYASREMEQK